MATESRTFIPGIAIQAPPAWGIEPVPQEHRRLRAIDIAVLWGDLGVGLLVLAAGALLPAVLGLTLAETLVAIVLGSVIGAALPHLESRARRRGRRPAVRAQGGGRKPGGQV